LKGLNSASGFVRRVLASRIQIRKTPEIKFICDDSIEQSARISKMLDDLAKGE
jgi:ribosome-binding factor A